MDLSSMPKGQTAIAVDTKNPYAEANLGILEPGPTQWKSPYVSDWAITVGVSPVSEGTKRPNPPNDLLTE